MQFFNRFIKSVTKEPKPIPPKRQPKIHDYSYNGWGHACYITDVMNEGYKAKAYGFGTGIYSNDILEIVRGENRYHYKVDSIRYTHDPSDMWFAELSFVPPGKDN